LLLGWLHSHAVACCADHGAAFAHLGSCALPCVLQWGGGIMGIKSQHKQKHKERVLAKELAQRMTV
jgi:hypothetical protein